MLSENFHDDDAIHVWQHAVVLVEIEPHSSAVGWKLKPEVVEARQREVVSDVFESDLPSVLPYHEAVRVPQLVGVLRHVVQNLADVRHLKN